MLTRAGILCLALVCCLPALTKAQQFFGDVGGCVDCGQVQSQCDCEQSSAFATGGSHTAAPVYGYQAATAAPTYSAYSTGQQAAVQQYAFAASNAYSDAVPMQPAYTTAQLPTYAAQQYVTVPQTMVQAVVQQPAYQIQYQQQAQVQQVPVTTYRNVTVDQGSYQTVWVPRPVTQQVAQTTMQSQVNYRTVAVPVATTQTQLAYVPAATMQTAQTAMVSSPLATAPMYAAQPPANMFASAPTYTTAAIAPQTTSVPMIAADPGMYTGMAADYGLPLMQAADPAHAVSQPMLSTNPAMAVPQYSTPMNSTPMNSPSMNFGQTASVPMPSDASQWDPITSVPSSPMMPLTTGPSTLVPQMPTLRMDAATAARQSYEPAQTPTRRRSAKGLFSPVRPRSSVWQSRYTRQR